MTIAIIHQMICIAYFRLLSIQTETVLHVAIDNGHSDKVASFVFLASFLSPPEQQSVALGGREDHHGCGSLLINIGAELIAIYLEISIATERSVEAHLNVCRGLEGIMSKVARYIPGTSFNLRSSQCLPL